MTTDQIRESFLNFFEKKGHKIVSSDSLVPQNDPTLLFTGAGMNQFKDYFLGVKKDLQRAASSQKCLRTGDLDNVGRTPYHHSFFEMLGNFSFGDYFKNEAISWAWEFLTEAMRISRDRLRVSVHENDEEAFLIWRDTIKIRPDWIVKLGDKDNFWPSNAPKDGPNGPCGPCSEIYFDQGEGVGCGNTSCNVDCDCGRFAEIWNLVFTQYNRRDGGALAPLAAKNIDTGMGLERLACVIQGKRTNFEIDTLDILVRETEKILGLKKPVCEVTLRSLCAIVDHARAVVFAIHDGAIPSNEGRGYVVRKLIRRAVWHGRQAGAKGAFLFELVPPVIEVMEKAYPELKQAEKNLMVTLRAEEERFVITLEQGTMIVQEMIQKTKNRKAKTLSGDNMFKLYDTYGFPGELTELIVAQEGLHVDLPGFQRLMEEQRARSKQKSEISGEIFVLSDLAKKLAGIAKTEFLGYETLEASGKVLFLEESQGRLLVVLNQTPFYGEGGGQVGDQGILESPAFRGGVTDTQKEEDRILHSVKIEKGTLKIGDVVRAKVNPEKRNATRRNHTATHILQAVLRKLLGAHVRQLGSLVNEDKLRFDFSHPKALTLQEIEAVENKVNEIILDNIPACTEVKSIEEAKKEGALAFFGDKYGEKVRLLRVGDFSLEFCGGTHVSRTGDIGAFIITQESSVASGTRRIEALTGMNALKYTRQLRAGLNEAAGLLKSSTEEISERIKKLQSKLKEAENRSGAVAPAQALDVDSVAARVCKLKNFSLVSEYLDHASAGDLRAAADRLKQKLKASVIVLFSADPTQSKVNVLVALSEDLDGSAVDARDILKKVAAEFEGSGGGRKDLAQG
ncbi:MAG: alanine--tRNA ligase, partial [Candidatus Omnitrophica bacterium]|nr:alanine--tRNA ligase [Candidatus Omnitrophota bacterium]